MNKVIVVTGPECSGKSVLSIELSRELLAEYHPEYAVEYLRAINRPYHLNDLEAIALEQSKRRQEAKNRNAIQIYDTGSLVLRIWADERFGQVPEAIHSAFTSERADLYLLCYPDLEWEQDESDLRENPDDRDRLFERYLALLEELNLRYAIIRGEDRVKQALEIITA